VRLIGIFVTSVLVLTGLNIQPIPAQAAEADYTQPADIPESSLADTTLVSSLQLSSNQTTNDESDIITLTATSDAPVESTNDSISIINSVSQETVAFCETGTTCTFDYLKVDYADSVTFYAKTTNVTSNSVEVYNDIPPIYLSSNYEEIETWGDFKLYIETEGVIPGNKYIYFADTDTNEIVSYCSSSEEICQSGDLNIDFTEGRTFKAYLADETGPLTVADLQGVVAESNTTEVSRAPWDVRLLTDTPVVTEGSTFALHAQTNQIIPSGLQLYIFDNTDKKFVNFRTDGSFYCTTDLTSLQCTEDFAFDQSHQYKAVLAASDPTFNESTTMDQLTDIRAESNYLKIRQLPFAGSMTITNYGQNPWGDYMYGFNGRLNQNTTHYSSAVIGGTGRILAVCKGYDGCEADLYPSADEYELVGADYVRKYPEENTARLVVGTWSGDTGQIEYIIRNPGGTMSNIQSSTNAATTQHTTPDLSALSVLTGGSNLSQECAQTCVADPINVVAGEFWLENLDASVNSSMPLVMSRYYAVSKRNLKGSLGYGWNTNYDMKLSPVGSSSLDTATTVDVFQENGSLITFTRNASGGYTTDLKTRATLTKTSTGFTLVRDKQTTFNFNATGSLTAVSDLNGNTVTINYSNNKISTVTNGKGQQIAFTWNAAGLIASVTTSQGRKTEYTYTTKQELQRVKHSDGTSVSYIYDADHAITSFNDELNRVTKNTYDDAKRVTSQTDALNNITSIEYLNNTTVVTQPNGRIDKHYYNEKYQVYRLETAAGSPEVYNEYYEYDAANNLTAIIYPDGGSYEFNYDANGNALQAKDRAGNVTTYTYNNQNRVTSEQNPAGKTRTVTYDSKGNMLEATDFKGSKTQYEINANGTLKKITSPDTSTAAFEYNSQGLTSKIVDALGDYTTQIYTVDGELATSTDARNNTTSYVYDTAGQLKEIIHPNGSKDTYTYDAAGNVTQYLDRSGALQTLTYDALNRPLTQKDALNRTVKQTFDNMGQVTKFTDAAGKITTAEYDILGQQTTITDARAKTTSFVYDKLGNVIQVIDPKLNTVFYNYDANNQVIKTVDSAGVAASASYNNLGQVIKTKDVQQKQTSYSYDDNGNLISTTLPNLKTQASVYDVMNQVTSHTDADGGVKAWAYDLAGQTTKFTNTDGSITQYGYDKVGNLLTETRPDSSVVNYEYSNTDQLTKEIFADSTNQFTYNAADMLVSEKQGTEEITYIYDAVGNVKERGPPTGGKVSYTYTTRDEIASITYPSAKAITYTYDNVGNLLTAVNAQTGTFRYTYDDANNLTKQTNPNGTTQTYTYSSNNKLENVDLKKGTTELYSKAYSYNQVSGMLDSATTNLTKPNNNSFTESYGYDSLSRLSNVKSDTTKAGKFEYTNTGNLTNNLGTKQSYNTGNQLVAARNKQYQFDARGNRTAVTKTGSTDTQSYSYNQANQLTSTTTGATTVDYKYDANGLLKSRTQGSETDSFTWDYLNGIPLLLDDGDYEYLYTIGTVPTAQVEKATGKVTYLHTDELGSVVAATSSTGALTGSYVYTPYGENQAPEGVTDPNHTVTRFGFAGEWKDPETGLYNLRMRWYEPGTGSFLTRDPLEQSTAEAYSYASGNPLANTDPLGLFSMGQGLYGGLDGVTGGISTMILNAIDPSIIDECDPAYTWGQVIGTVASFAIPGIGLAGLGLKAFGLTAKVAGVAVKTSKFVRSASKTTIARAKVVASSERASIPQPSLPKRWKVGEDINKPINGQTPKFKVIRQRYWKQEAAAAEANPGQLTLQQFHRKYLAPEGKVTEETLPWSPADITRMKKGLAPIRWNQRKADVRNGNGRESMELSHEPIPYRDGGTQVTQRWPIEHSAIDKYRHLDY